MLLAQAEVEIAAKVLEGLKDHQKQGGGFDTYAFLVALIVLFVLSFMAVRWVIENHRSTMKEITADHKDTCAKLAETFSMATKASRDMVHDARDITVTAVATNMSAQEAIEELRKSRERHDGKD